MFQAFSVTPTASSLYHTSTNGKLIPQRQHSGSLSPKTPFICTEIFLTPTHRSQLILFWPQCSVSRTYLALAVSVCPAPYHHHPAPNTLIGHLLHMDGCPFVQSKTVSHLFPHPHTGHLSFPCPILDFLAI